MGKTILIVDDDPAQRRLLQAAVERNGFSTRTAENGATAVDRGRYSMQTSMWCFWTSSCRA